MVSEFGRIVGEFGRVIGEFGRLVSEFVSFRFVSFLDIVCVCANDE